MNRVLTPELLDLLPADDNSAKISREDLRRINNVMGSVAVIAQALRVVSARSLIGPLRVLDIGAGDGTLFLRVARRLGKVPAGTEITLLDRQELLAPETRAEVQEIGWQVRAMRGDVLDWLPEANSTDKDRAKPRTLNAHSHRGPAAALFTLPSGMGQGEDSIHQSLSDHALRGDRELYTAVIANLF